MLFLSISLIINAFIGLIITNVSLDVFFVIDGLIKILFGSIFLSSVLLIINRNEDSVSQ